MSTPETPPSTGGDDPGRGRSGIQRAGIVLGGLALLLIVFVVLRANSDSGSSSSSSAPQTTATPGTTTGSAGSSSTASAPTATAPAQPAVQTVRVVNGKPDGGIQTVSFKKGEQVRLKVQSDTADEIHVHGYDLKKDVAAGGSVLFNFEASIEGRFDVELENAGTQIATLQVNPA